MRLTFSLYDYFPYGGLQRNCLSIARACAARGHDVRLVTRTWQGQTPDDLEVVLLPDRALTNHGRNERFFAAFAGFLARDRGDLVIGFNRLPALDLFYAADPCLAASAARRGAWYRRLPRVRHMLAAEARIFAPRARTKVLLVAPAEMERFRAHYGTPASAFHLLPPGIDRGRVAPADVSSERAGVRRRLGAGESVKVLIAIGSGFRTKGLDRSLRTLAAARAVFPETELWVIGQDRPGPFRRHARRLGVASAVRFLGGRDDVSALLFAADLLVHPAYRENTGNALLEAMVAGVPVVTTDVCGYAHYVGDANMGTVLRSPFAQPRLDGAVVELLGAERGLWRERGRRFAAGADIYDRAAHAADVIEATGAACRS